jgi:hypothetical protein
MNVENLRVATDFTLSAGGASLPVRELGVSVRRDGDHTVEARLTCLLTFEAWQGLERGPAFHLHEAERGPSFVGEFDPNKDVQVEARLDPALLPDLDAWDLALAIRKAAEGDPLRRTESWYALAVTQQMAGGARGGFSTQWFRPGE